MGYLPLLCVPGTYYQRNAESAIDNSKFVTKSVVELEQNRCIKMVVERPQVCSPLLIVTNSKCKKRLVLNLHYLNQFLFKESFKYMYEELHTAMLLFEKGDHLVTFNFMSGYHHVDIHEKHWT